MDLVKLRSLIITAVCSDDLLFRLLVLKGGNAITLIHGISARASVDIDFSMSGDFENLEDIRQRLFKALRERFDSNGLTLFDESLQRRPANPSDPLWIGYRAEFKLIEREKYDAVNGNLVEIRKRSLAIGDSTATRIFCVDISSYEYCGEKEEHTIDNFSCNVYTLPLIVIEKFRAIVQQMDDYQHGRHHHPRARDFFDIFTVLQARPMDLASNENLELFRKVFAAKKVPLSGLGKINETKDFHRPDWPSVQLTALGPIQDFDFYFNYVVKQSEKLKPLWVE